MPVRELREDHNLGSIMNAVLGFRRAKDRDIKLKWETTRWQVFHLINIQLGEEKKIQELTGLVRFPWEDKVEHKRKVMDPELMKMFKISKP